MRRGVSPLYALVVYDLDGTLADTLDDLTLSANLLLSELGRPPVPRERLKGYVGLGLRTLVQRCLETDEAERIERGMARYRAHYARHLLDRTRLYPSARRVLERFCDRQQAIVTNKPEALSRRILDGLGIAGYFRAVIGGDSGFGHKPDAAGLRALMAQAGASAQDTLLIGDSPVDIETGRHAGVHTVGVAHGFAGLDELRAAAPGALVSDFEELLSLANAASW